MSGGSRRRRLVLLSTAIAAAAAVALTLAAMVTLNEAVAVAVPSLVRANLEQRAKGVAPDLAGPAPERSSAARWLQEQRGGISDVQLSRHPHVTVAVSSSVGLMVIVDRRARVVAVRGWHLPAGASLWRHLPGRGGAVLRAALSGRDDGSGLTARLRDGSVVGAASIFGPGDRVVGALLATFRGLDQVHLLAGALLSALGVSVIVAPPAGLSGGLIGLFVGRGTRSTPESAGTAARLPLVPAADDGPPLASFSVLTARELEVLRLLAAAGTNADIAQRLHISESTVKKHVSNILGKLEVPDRTRAAVLAWERGLVTREP